MSEDMEMPATLKAVMERARQQIEHARLSVDTSMQVPGAWAKIDAGLVDRLYRATHDSGSCSGLSHMLAAVASMGAALGQDRSQERSVDRRREMLHALLDAAFADIVVDRTKQQGVARPWCAMELEAVLDDWVARGAHRVGRQGSPLTQIAQLIEHTSESPEAMLQTRFGLVIPVIAVLRMWRLLQQANPQQQQQCGWGQSGPVGEAPDASSPEPVSSVN